MATDTIRSLRAASNVSWTSSNASTTVGSTAPFEYQAFEAVFETVIAAQNQEYLKLASKIRSILNKIKDAGLLSVSTQSKLSLYKTRMNQLLLKATLHRKALEELMDEDDTMALMNLSKLMRTPGLYK
jgi:hypothetical protein